ncbi:MAG: hypothetical protein L3J20_09985 [Flavobacteriaceae bacterium]|nr:hypothetical protein [Flavobacteriaceae bacterium]
MVRIILFIFVFTSCTNSSLSRILTNNSTETLLTYKLYSRWIGDSKFNSKRKDQYTIIEEYRNIDGSSLSTNEYLNFYDNGKILFFYVPKNIDLNKYEINPKNGIIGNYENKDKIIYMKYKLGTGHWQKKIKSKAIINRDTLHLIEKIANHNIHKIYIRIKRNYSPKTSKK